MNDTYERSERPGAELELFDGETSGLALSDEELLLIHGGMSGGGYGGDYGGGAAHSSGATVNGDNGTTPAEVQAILGSLLAEMADFNRELEKNPPYGSK